jgi:cell wall-associated NlpC family hydrolase
MAQEILQRAAPFVGTPYRLHGRSPAAWDCWGCVAYLRESLFDKPTPSWADVYTLEDGANAVRLAKVVEERVRERLHAWRRVPAQPGAVVLLSFFDRVAHIGLMLTHQDFIHALHGCETVIDRIDGPRWSTRHRGCFDA